MAIHSESISVNAVGVTVTSGAASANVALPVGAGGALPKFIRLQSSGFAFIKLGPAGVTATTNDLYLSPNEAVIMVSAGFPFMAYIQDTAAVKINIVPLEA